ncbi:MAG: LytTR family DNA-binding domain-containing protein [Bacteroidota bacterium]
MIRVFIADDEPPARNRLRSLLDDIDPGTPVQVVGEAGDGPSTLHALADQEVDVLLLDIRMPGLDGFEVLERLSPESRPVVVFTTAYDTYAVRAFEASAVDYLLKPIGRGRLEDALSKADRLLRAPADRTAVDERLGALLDWVEARAQAAPPPAAQGPVALPTETLRQLSIPYPDRILVVPVGQLVSAEINEGITRLFVLEETRTGAPRLRKHVVSYTLDQLESNLDPSDFMRVHRSALIGLEHIRELIPWFSGRFKVMLAGDHEVIASRDRSKLLRDRLML